jgi:hypothetical protein
MMTGFLLKFIKPHTSIFKDSKARYMLNDSEYSIKHFRMIFVNLNAIQKNYFYEECK